MTPIDVERATELYEHDGLTLKEAADKLGAPVHRLRADLAAAGVRIRGKREKWLPDDELARCYFDGATLEALAAEHGVSATTVRYHLERIGVTIDAQPTERRDIDDRQLAREYAAGASSDDLAVRHGCGATTIRRRLRRVGVTIRPSGNRLGSSRPKRVNFDVAEAARRYTDDGESLDEVGVRFGCSAPTVKVRFLAAGVQIRRQGERGKRAA